jgi:GNAT superfamily N-acetyltransferase
MPAHANHTTTTTLVQSFFPGAGPFTPLCRLDRVMGLQVGYENASQSKAESPARGPFLCLVAVAPDAPAAGASPPAPPRPAWPAAWLPPSMWGAFTADPAGQGILGAVVVDVQGGHVPARSVRARGTVRLEPRKGLAYISNLAVDPRARRAGVGSALVAAAEAQAWAWGCHGLALHVNARDNGGADVLYRQRGFRPVRPGSEGGSGLGAGALLGPAGQPLTLMLKVRPRRGEA